MFSASAASTALAKRCVHYEACLTRTAQARQPSPIRELAALSREPGMISLAGGMPNNSCFPFASFCFNVPNKSSILGNTLNAADHDHDHENETQLDELCLTASELDMALQYAPSKGIPPLYEWLRQFHHRVHQIPYADWDLIIGTGSQDLIARVLDSVLEEGDTILIEAPCYSGTIAFLQARNINVVAIEMDEHGMSFEHLQRTLAQLASQREIQFPKLIYTIPVGQNPSGASYSYARKQQIYELICAYDNLLLFEDDAYYFLNFECRDHSQLEHATSFQSMDTAARVIRSDSFSKTLSSGLRLGYLTGHQTLIRNIELNLQSSCLHTSALSQMVVYKLLTHWDVEIFFKHLANVCEFYQHRCRIFGEILERHFGCDNEGNDAVVTWKQPKGGMFYWLELQNVEDTGELIRGKAREEKVLLLSGKYFYMKHDPRSQKSSFVRASYSMATEKDMNEGIRRFANILQNYHIH